MALPRTGAAVALMLSAPVAFAAELPDAIAAKGETVVLQVHAEGAQIYECKSTTGGQQTWQFREPIASLFHNGATVGRHYAGPRWEIGGGVLLGKAVGNAPSAGPEDIAWLKLDVAERQGDGPLQDVTIVQRINTNGGNFAGSCERAGDLHAEPYSADYVFLRKAS
jgi:Protein of unknown function (DUF3455)